MAEFLIVLFAVLLSFGVGVHMPNSAIHDGFAVARGFCHGAIFGAVIGGIAGVLLLLFGDLANLVEASPEWFWLLMAIGCGMLGGLGALRSSRPHLENRKIYRRKIGGSVWHSCTRCQYWPRGHFEETEDCPPFGLCPACVQFEMQDRWFSGR
jgi:hypothetical protein